MRIFFPILGWSSTLGGCFVGSLILYFVSINITDNWLSLHISVNDFLRDHVAIIYWIKQLAYYILPSNLVALLFNLPAIVLFPVRLTISTFIGWWAFSKAAKLSTTSTSIKPLI